MNLFLIILSIILKIQILTSFDLKPANRDITTRLIIRDIISENKLKGFLICDIFNNGKTTRKDKISDFVKYASSMTTVTFVNPKIQVAKFLRKDKLNLYSSDVIFTVLFLNKKIANSKKGVLKWLTIARHLTLVQSASKALIIAIINQKENNNNYKQLFREMFNGNNYNIDVIGIKGSTFKVFQFDPFEKTLKKTIYKSKFQFFNDLMKNLHHHKFHVKPIDAKVAKYDWNINRLEYRIHYIPNLYPIELAITMMNGTFKYVSKMKGKQLHDITLVKCDDLPLLRLVAFIYPVDPRAIFFILPTLYDEHHTESFDVLLTSVTVIIVIILIFWLLSRICNFDALTWDPISIFSMIIEVSNPRSPVSTSELISYMTLVFVGFFFGGDLIEGLNSVYMIQRSEKSLVTLEDIANNNITLLFVKKHKSSWTQSELSKIRHVEADYNTYTRSFRHMLHSKNISLTPFMLQMYGISVPERIIINNVVHARLSNVRDRFSSFSYILPRNQPWLHHLSRNLMRYHESALQSLPKLLTNTRALRAAILEESMNANTQEGDDEESSLSSDEFKTFGLIIAFGFVASLGCLVAEYLISKRGGVCLNEKSNCNIAV